MPWLSAQRTDRLRAPTGSVSTGLALVAEGDWAIGQVFEVGKLAIRDGFIPILEGLATLGRRNAAFELSGKHPTFPLVLVQRLLRVAASSTGGAL
jgi:hypothetical protein